MTKQEKIAHLSLALECIETMHGSVTGCGEHVGDVLKCACQYSLSMRYLKAERRSLYCHIVKDKRMAKLSSQVKSVAGAE